MPTNQDSIAELIRSCTELKNYFEKVRDEIEADRAQMRADIKAHIDTADSRIPLPPNLIQNAFMRGEVDGAVPRGFAGNGLKIEAVHPFTQGFEGPYLRERPANAVDDPSRASRERPYWYGVYYMGPRSGRGGLADGWGGITDGKILKVTAAAGAANSQRILYFSSQRLGAHDRIWFRCYVKIVRGSRVGFGIDSGYYGKAQGLIVTKEQSDNSPQGWYKVDALIDQSRTTQSVIGATLSGGAQGDEDVEFYLALPYAYIPLNAEMGIIE